MEIRRPFIFAVSLKVPSFDVCFFGPSPFPIPPRRLEFLLGGREAAEHTDPTLPEEIRMTCQQFVRYHRDHCVKTIVKGRR